MNVKPCDLDQVCSSEKSISLMGISNFDELNRDFASGGYTDNMGGVYQSVDESDRGLDISGFFRILKQQWLLIAMMTLLSLAAAIARALKW